MPENFSEKAGFGISPRHNFIVQTGKTTNDPAEPVDLGRLYAFIVIACTDPSHAAASSNTIKILVSDDIDGPMLPLGDDEGEEIAHQIGSAAFYRRYFVGAARRVQLVMSAAASGGTIPFYIVGVDAGLR